MKNKILPYFSLLIGLAGYTTSHAQTAGLVKPAKTNIVRGVADTECSNTLPGPDTGDTGCVTFTYQGQTVTYATVRAADGKIWLQQNLGSSQIATASNDASSYGDYFQWGRWDDGHQKTTSPTVSAPVPNNPEGLQIPSNAFITGTGANGWWSNNLLTDKWEVSTPENATDVNGCDPCKALGEQWKMPSQTDWTDLKNAENISNPATAFSSSLKLSAAGYRSNSSAGYTFIGERLYYWSSTPSSSGSKYFYVSSLIANPAAGAVRGQGSSIRCVLAQEPIASVAIQVEANAAPAITTNGGTLQLSATILPATADQQINWSLADESTLATIDANGLVTAVANGTVTVKAVSVTDNTKSDTLEIVISNQGSSSEFPAPYCGDEAITTLTVSEITEVTFGSVTHTSGINETPATTIENFTETILNANQGATYPVTIKGGTQGQTSVSAYVYIDFNQNNIFDADEAFTIGYLDNSNPVTGVESGTVSGNITIPADALTGTTRFRVVKAYESDSWMGVLENLPCPTGWFIGQVEDYTIEIAEALPGPVDDYCEVAVDFDVEPITYVSFANIDNTTSEAVNGTPAYEDFTAITGDVITGETYVLKVKGNTNGQFSHDVRVFIDWNQDFTFDMETEYYTASLEPSTGTDDVGVAIEITIPQDAVLGTTRMRIIKDMWNVYEPGEFDACTNAYYGQVEDYTLNIQEQTASNGAFDKPEINVYPNPTTGMVTISSETEISKVELFDLTGKKTAVYTNATFDISHLAAGMYQTKISFGNGKQSFVKIIKK